MIGRTGKCSSDLHDESFDLVCQPLSSNCAYAQFLWGREWEEAVKSQQ